MLNPSAFTRVASLGIITRFCGPAATILDPRTTTTAFSIGLPPRPSINRAPTIAMTLLDGGSGGDLISRKSAARPDGPTVARMLTTIIVHSTHTDRAGET